VLALLWRLLSDLGVHGFQSFMNRSFVIDKLGRGERRVEVGESRTEMQIDQSRQVAGGHKRSHFWHMLNGRMKLDVALARILRNS